MTKSLIFRISIRIKAPAANIVTALTTPKLTKNYMFGAERYQTGRKGARSSGG